MWHVGRARSVQSDLLVLVSVVHKVTLSPLRGPSKVQTSEKVCREGWVRAAGPPCRGGTCGHTLQSVLSWTVPTVAMMGQRSVGVAVPLPSPHTAPTVSRASSCLFC